MSETKTISKENLRARILAEPDVPVEVGPMTAPDTETPRTDAMRRKWMSDGRMMPLFRDIAELESELAAALGRYNELILAVGNKYPGETRHQTAFRYIQQAERTTGEASQDAHLPEHGS